MASFLSWRSSKKFALFHSHQLLQFWGWRASYGKMDVAKKRKVKKFRKVEAVKALARERVGAPPAGQIVVNKKEKKEKHKPTLEKFSGEA